ncbi:hypothetical protein ACHQM5_003321 [Ranunculus cassubicifolius]
MIQLIIFFLVTPSVFSVNQEGIILQRVKLGFDDPDQVLSNWNSRDSTPCNWYGIVCDSSNSSVSSVEISNTNIKGEFPSELCLLLNLSRISLDNNFINGSLPPLISTCRNLRHLNLSENLLVGPIPSTLPEIPSLRFLCLSGNNFSGDIPTSFAGFRELETLNLVGNLLNGTIPAELGNMSSLKELSLASNPFSPGPIPSKLGDLANLEVLWLSECNLIGEVPESLGQLGNLKNLDLSLNNLNGRIPNSLTELTNIVQIELYNNSLTGELPLNFSQLKSLRRFDVSSNSIGGRIPNELCELPLESLNLHENRFVGSLPESIARSPNLYELKLFDNRLSGELPKNLGANSPLQMFDASTNKFSGKIPVSLCKHGALEELLLIYNSFSGPIPEELSHCRSLRRIRVRHNKLSGEVPSGVWGLPHVSLLELAENELSGSISRTIALSRNLSILSLSKNRFTGSIPNEIGRVNTLVEISANDNKLSGSLPSSLLHLSQLVRLDVHGNELSGDLPIGVGSWKKLNELNLRSNSFSGNIPVELGSLPVLNYLDLSNNLFVGKIPFELQNLKLSDFNLSNNHLSGTLPPLYAKEIYRDSFLGNPGLCGDLKGLCQTRIETQNRDSIWLFLSIVVLAVLVLIVGLAMFYLKYRSFKKVKKGIEKSKWTLTSFHKVGFNEFDILDSLDEDNVIGSGASGKVYKVVLSNGVSVAVKKLWGESIKDDTQIRDDGFEAEVETLGKIRHKNIVKLWCCCTTKDCKLLIYEYMPNGSLGDLLHSTKSGLLDWPTRYKIAVDAAEGLSYLHHDCAPPIVHRDIKSNNILLDAEFGAKVADFGVAKVIDTISQEAVSMSVIAGSCGYIAPEYAYTLRVNEKSDIYSFGVVILELVTGRLANDPEFGEKDLVKWVCYTVDQKGVEHVTDPKLDTCFKEEIARVLSIGILCTSPLPINRPSMRRVVKMLQEVNVEIKCKNLKDGKLSVYEEFENSSEQENIV